LGVRVVEYVHVVVLEDVFDYFGGVGVFIWEYVFVRVDECDLVV